MLESIKLKKEKITFVVSSLLQKEMQEKIIAEGYGLKGKSRWVAEAITQLLQNPNFAEFVSLNKQMSGLEKSESVVLDNALTKKLEEAILHVRKIFPTLDGLQSCIIRTAIIQRCLRGYKKTQ